MDFNTSHVMVLLHLLLQWMGQIKYFNTSHVMVLRNPLNSAINGMTMNSPQRGLSYAMAGGQTLDANNSPMSDIVINNITTLDGEVIASSTERINTRNDRRFNPTKK